MSISTINLTTASNNTQTGLITPGQKRYREEHQITKEFLA